MDPCSLARSLGLLDSPSVTRKAQELQRLSKVQFDSASFGLGEVCKSVLCFEMASSLLHVEFDRQRAIRVSGLSEKAYIRSLTNLQNALGVRPNLDVRELAVQFGCVRLMGSVHRTLAQYKQRFIAALPESRKGSADFGRPVFTAVAFYLCAKKNKLKVDKMRLMELCGTSDLEFAKIATSMLDLCFDMVGIEREKKDPKSIKCNRDLLDALPEKRKLDHDDSESDPEIDDGLEVPGVDLSKQRSKTSYEAWKASIMSARESSQKLPDAKRTKQVMLDFTTIPKTTGCAVPIL